MLLHDISPIINFVTKIFNNKNVLKTSEDSPSIVSPLLNQNFAPTFVTLQQTQESCKALLQRYFFQNGNFGAASTRARSIKSLRILRLFDEVCLPTKQRTTNCCLGFGNVIFKSSDDTKPLATVDAA